LQQLTDASAHQIEHWFDHPEVRHRLGGRFWIHRELRLLAQRPGEEFQGAVVLGSYGWVALDEAGTPVAFIGGDVYDRLSADDRRTAMGLGYVVDPARWRQGYGRAAIEAVLCHPDLGDVTAFFCGIDADNVASQRCAQAAGFHLVDPRPDHEGMVFYRRER
jgi:RimJ/RimL family protein N-acetyltransferase